MVNSMEDKEETFNTIKTTKKRYGGARGVSSVYKVVMIKALGKKKKVQ